MDLFDETTFACSKLITNRYSTSFSLGIKSLDKKFHPAIYAIYGFVRFADEIVDTFHLQDKESLLLEFEEDTYKAIRKGISLNPVLNSFQQVVNQYDIPHDLIDSFLYSMKMDLTGKQYDQVNYSKYIYGSAEVVGLMCLKVFCEKNTDLYTSLTSAARSLGAAFQKVNFLRDLSSDYLERGRTYFPNVDFTRFDANSKRHIEEDILKDFDAAYEGIKKLPSSSRLGVHLAYIYYKCLYNKIKALPASEIISARVRVPDSQKLLLMAQTWLTHRFIHS